MSYARVETSVRTNRKFLQAGPSASWLWLCGVLYCQETLTDGFIPFEAVKFLGVDNPKPLIPKLVKARLWDEVDGGWMIHDYLQHNKSADSINQIKDAKRQAGKQGGEASGRSRVLQQEMKQASKHSANPLVDVAVADAAVVAEVKEGGLGETDLDMAFLEFRQAYPSHRAVLGQSERMYFDAVSSGLTTPAGMLSALRNHIASEQWQNPQHVPNMDKWLERKSWTMTMPPPKLAGTTEKTAGNADALRRFVERHSAAN